MEKIEVFGELNQSKDILKRASGKIKMLWNDGIYRLLPDDIEQIEIILREMKGELATIKSISNLFKDITNNKITNEKEE